MIPASKHGSILWIVALLMVLSVAAQAQPTMSVVNNESSGAAVTAQWRDYDLKFHYSSFYTWYNCDSVEDKVKRILRSLGAAPEVKVSVLGCYGVSNLGNMLIGHIKVQMPTVGETQPLSTGEPQAGFAAVYQPVTLKSRERGYLSNGDDCELLEQVRDQVLTKLGLDIVRDDIRCVPGQAVIGVQSMQVRALLPQTALPK